jgi:hypothetical protein
MMGWDADTGNPTDVKLRELGLGWITDLDRAAGPALAAG